MLRSALLFAVTLSAVPASAFEARHDSSGVPVRWRERLELVIDRSLLAAIGDGAAEDAMRAAARAVGAGVKTVTISMRVGDPAGLGYVASAPEKNQNDVIGLEDWPYQDGALAATLLTLNGTTHEILDADIVFNLEQHHFGVLPSQGLSSSTARLDDVQNTLTHELGHALGLMHNPADPKVVMYPGAVPGETSKRTLAEDDLGGLASLYDAAPPAQDASPFPAVGCAQTPAPAALWLLAPFLVWVASRRRP